MQATTLLFIYYLLNFGSVINEEPQIKIVIKEVVMENCTFSDTVSFLNSSILRGKLIIYNNTNKTIKLPKSLDLQIILTDSVGNIVNKRKDIIDEYVNLLFFSKDLKINKLENRLIGFSDQRLLLYKLKEGEKYHLQYVLNVSQYDKLKKQIKADKIYSNAIEFEY